MRPPHPGRAAVLASGTPRCRSARGRRCRYGPVLASYIYGEQLAVYLFPRLDDVLGEGGAGGRDRTTGPGAGLRDKCRPCSVGRIHDLFVAGPFARRGAAAGRRHHQDRQQPSERRRGPPRGRADGRGPAGESVRRQRHSIHRRVTTTGQPCAGGPPGRSRSRWCPGSGSSSGSSGLCRLAARRPR
jgi:hypothetical protein